MKRFIKFCEPKHNLLKGCGKLHLGTLSYFRGLDPQFSSDQIVDKTEGTESLIVGDACGRTISEDARKELSPFIQLKPEAVVKNLNLTDMRRPNCFVWCCYCPSPDEPLTDIQARGRAFDSKYEDCYEIINADAFANQIAALLLKQPLDKLLCSSELKRLLNLSLEDLGAIQVGFRGGHVHYVDTKASCISDGILETYLKEVPISFRAIFAKPSEYAWQQEYRFVFWVVHPRLSCLSVRHEPLLLSLLPIAPLT